MTKTSSFTLGETAHEGQEQRFLLVVPAGAINTRTGGGQRSAVFFSALKMLGPTAVAILGDHDGEGPCEFFPDADFVRFVSSQNHSSPPKEIFKRLILNFKKLFFSERYFAHDPKIVVEIKHIKKRFNPELTLYRYFHTFSVSEMALKRGGIVAVDIDDRDDQKYERYLISNFPKFIMNSLSAWLVRPIRKILISRLKMDAALVWVASAEDQEILQHSMVRIAPNVPFFSSHYNALTPPSEGCGIIFVGSFEHRPNQRGIIWFLSSCWPLLTALVPSAELRIVGLGDWSSFATRFPHLNNVTYVGMVDDLTTEYERARLAISPIFEGGGTKIKVIEASSFMRPVVATSHSARGIHQDLVSSLRLADDPNTFVKNCITYLMDGALADSVGSALKAVQNLHYSRPAVEASIANDIREALAFRLSETPS